MAGPKLPPKKGGAIIGSTSSTSGVKTPTPGLPGVKPAPTIPKVAGASGPKPPPKGAPMAGSGSTAAAMPATGAKPQTVFGSAQSRLRGSAGNPALQPLRPAEAKKPLSGLGTAGGKARAGVARDESPHAIEERVFAIPGLKDVKMPPLFSDFEQKIVPKIRLAETSHAILQAFSNIDVNAERIAQTLRSNPYYEALFLRYLQAMGRVAEGVKLEAAIVLLGMQNSRNLILALQTMRTVRGTHPEWTKEGKLKIAPNEVLRYALKTEEVLSGRKDAYADTAYAAGMVFDILALLADEFAQDKKRVLGYIDTLYMHGLKTAQIGVELAKSIPDFSYSKYVYSTCLLHDIGKIVLAILDPNYLAFIEDCAKRELPRAVRLFAENRRFGTNHAVLGGLSFEHFQVFKVTSKAILFHHEPFLLGGGRRGLGQLASIICIATSMASNFKKTDKPDDPAVKLWKTLEVKDFPLDFKAMMAAAFKVG